VEAESISSKHECRQQGGLGAVTPFPLLFLVNLTRLGVGSTLSSTAMRAVIATPYGSEAFRDYTRCEVLTLGPRGKNIGGPSSVGIPHRVQIPGVYMIKPVTPESLAGLPELGRASIFETSAT
jgi:hypothetical protein